MPVLSILIWTLRTVRILVEIKLSQQLAVLSTPVGWKVPLGNQHIDAVELGEPLWCFVLRIGSGS